MKRETHYRYAYDDSGVQRRYFELRVDEANERRITGTAMRYGDVATLPWGDKERFEAGAFGEVGGLDVILNVQHDRSQPIARTGGTLRLSDSGGELRIEADLPDTTIANDAVANIRARILRGFSVEFSPVETRKEDGVIIVEKAKLPAIGLVDRPAYPKSKVLPRSEDDMNDTEINDLVKRSVTEALEKRSEGDPPDAAAIATAVAGAIGSTLADMPTAESVRADVDAALKLRDDAEAERAKEEDKRKKAEKKAKDDEEMMKKKADDRADLLLTVKPLLADDTETRAMTNHELLVAAVGDEVSGAKDRSEDYLLAKVEAIAERRAAAATGTSIVQKPGAPAPSTNPVNMTRFIEQRNQAKRATA